MNRCPLWMKLLAFHLTLSVSGGLLLADEITLTDDARLTGTVRGIQESGAIELESELSPEPLVLKPGAVISVNFSSEDESADDPTHLLNLTNGDVLPIDIEAIDETSLHATTACAGDLTISRKALKSIRFGVHKEPLIDKGESEFEDWLGENGRRNEHSKGWSNENESLIANGPATATKSYSLPSQFAFKFTLKWQAAPNFQVTLADPFTPKASNSDRYVYQFSDEGMELRRELGQGKRALVLIHYLCPPDAYPGKQASVEIRVDRLSSRLELVLDGVPAASGFDPTPQPPEGNNITLISLARVGSTQKVSNIQMLHFNGMPSPGPAVNGKMDRLISRQGESWDGNLTVMNHGLADSVFRFKTDASEQPMEFLQEQLVQLDFAQPEPAPQTPSDQFFKMKLQGGGTLQLKSCVFEDDAIRAVHPLLGEIRISRSCVLSLDWGDSEAIAKQAKEDNIEAAENAATEAAQDAVEEAVEEGEDRE